jgi:hypothetical protein
MNRLPEVDELVRSVEASSDADLDRVRVAVELADELGVRGDAVVTHFVEAARAAGCSWSQIGGQLGVSKQAAQQAFVSAGPGRGRGRRGRFGRGPGGPGEGHGHGRPFERFAGAARAVVERARAEALSMGASHIGTEHLLLGILDQEEGAGAAALARLGVEAEGVRRKITEIVGPGSATGPRRPLAPRAKEVFALAARESAALGDNRIGTGHILLGIVAEGEGVAARILVDLGADLPKVRETVLQELRTAGGPRTPDGPRTD